MCSFYWVCGCPLKGSEAINTFVIWNIVQLRIYPVCPCHQHCNNAHESLGSDESSFLTQFAWPHQFYHFASFFARTLHTEGDREGWHLKQRKTPQKGEVWWFLLSNSSSVRWAQCSFPKTLSPSEYMGSIRLCYPVSTGSVSRAQEASPSPAFLAYITPITHWDLLVDLRLLISPLLARVRSERSMMAVCLIPTGLSWVWCFLHKAAFYNGAILRTHGFFQAMLSLCPPSEHFNMQMKPSPDCLCDTGLQLDWRSPIATQELFQASLPLFELFLLSKVFLLPPATSTCQFLFPGLADFCLSWKTDYLPPPLGSLPGRFCFLPTTAEVGPIWYVFHSILRPLRGRSVTLYSRMQQGTCMNFKCGVHT